MNVDIKNMIDLASVKSKMEKREIAKKMGYDHGSVISRISRQNDMKISQIIKLSKATGIPMKELLKDAGLL